MVFELLFKPRVGGLDVGERFCLDLEHARKGDDVHGDATSECNVIHPSFTFIHIPSTLPETNGST